MLTATYLINRFPSPVLDGQSPYERLFSTIHQYSHLKFFGCLSFISTPKVHRDKFSPRAIPYIFIGYPFGKKAKKFLDIKNKQIHISRDAVFHEDIFPLVTDSASHVIPLPVIETIVSTSSHTHIDDNRHRPSSPPVVSPPTSSIPPVRRSTRISKVPFYLYQYVHPLKNHCTESVCSCTMTTFCQPQSVHDIPQISVACCSVNYHSSLPPSEPNTYAEAVQYPEWQDVIAKEFSALESNNTWTVVPLPPGKKTIASKWVLKKMHADGTIERHKAHLVMKRFTQREGIDFTKTFSPVVKMTTIRSLVAVVVKKGWNLTQVNVNNAFLHGDLHEDVYMKPPLGLNIPAGFVCKFQKSLYGLRKASGQWHSKLSVALISRGYKSSKNDCCLFYKRKTGIVVFLAV